MKNRKVLGIPVVTLKQAYSDIEHTVLESHVKTYVWPVAYERGVIDIEKHLDRYMFWHPVTVKHMLHAKSLFPTSTQDHFFKSIYNALKAPLLKELSSNLTQVSSNQEGLFNAFMSLMNDGVNEEDLKLIRTAPRTYVLVDLSRLRLVTSTYYTLENLDVDGIRTEFKAAFFNLSNQSNFVVIVPRSPKS